MHKSFLSKLEELSARRDVTPWLKSMGMSTGVIGRIMAGGEPGADLLRALARTERVSLRWLEQGRGAPYEVTRVGSDEEAIAFLQSFPLEQYGVAFATADNRRFLLILHEIREYEYKKQTVSYREVEIVAGNISIKTIRWLASQGRGLHCLALSADEFNRLAGGQMGNIELFGFEDRRKQSPGLFARIKSTRHDSDYAWLHTGDPAPASFSVNESGAAYGYADDVELLTAVMGELNAVLGELRLSLSDETKTEMVALLFDGAKKTGALPDKNWLTRLVRLID